MKEAIITELHDSVVKGEYGESKKLTQLAIERGIPAMIIAESLINAVNEAAEKVRKRKYYIAEIIYSTRAFNEGLNLVLPKLKEEKAGAPPKGRIVFGVIGGPWDFGKDIVVGGLRANGFEVFDVGFNIEYDRPLDVITDKVKEVNADIIGISFYLSYTVPYIKKVDERLRELGIRDKVKIMVGGPAVNERIAKRYGADAYGKDVIEAVNIAKRVMVELEREGESQ